MSMLSRWSGMICLLLASVPGCGPRVDPAELGEMSKTLPALPGTNEPYPMPELEKPEETAGKGVSSDTNSAAPTPQEPAENAVPAEQSP